MSQFPVYNDDSGSASNNEEITIKYSADVEDLKKELKEVTELTENLQKALVKLGLSINMIISVDTK